MNEIEARQTIEARNRERIQRISELEQREEMITGMRFIFLLAAITCLFIYLMGRSM